MLKEAFELLRRIPPSVIYLNFAVLLVLATFRLGDFSYSDSRWRIYSSLGVFETGPVLGQSEIQLGHGIKTSGTGRKSGSGEIFNSHCLERTWCMYPTSVQQNPFSEAIQPNLLDEVRNEAFHEAY
jgi:hypothetical protein